MREKYSGRIVALMTTAILGPNLFGPSASEPLGVLIASSQAGDVNVYRNGYSEPRNTLRPFTITPDRIHVGGRVYGSKGKRDGDGHSR